ncbi:MAG: hypothetical protein L3K24_12795 [Gammaproteobacteria bacterium]|nr:hypothetical protein [Gammaproteobacteria bacterium]
MKAQNIILVMLFAGLLLMIQSCGSGNDDNNPLPGNTLPSGQLNGGLEGYFLWSNSDGRNERLDISTGRWRKIPVIQDWIEKNKEMRNINGIADSYTRFTNNGQFALKVIQNCDRDVGSVLDDIIAQCIVVFDLANQSVISDFKVSPITGSFLYEIALSDDGQYIAILDNNASDQYRVRIYDLSGNEIDESFYSDRLDDEFVKVDGLEWLPDGRLIFAYGPTIMLSIDLLSTSARPLKVFLPSQGKPIHLRVSPDGTKIAYVLKIGGPISWDSTLWVMDVKNGSNAYQLVKVLDDILQPRMQSPAWSQDGKWITFEFGGFNGWDISNPGVPPGLLVISSDGVKEPIGSDGTSKSSPDDIVRIFSYYRFVLDDWSDVDRLRDSFPEGRVTWVMP